LAMDFTYGGGFESELAMDFTYGQILPLSFESELAILFRPNMLFVYQLCDLSRLLVLDVRITTRGSYFPFTFFKLSVVRMVVFDFCQGSNKDMMNELEDACSFFPQPTNPGTPANGRAKGGGRMDDDSDGYQLQDLNYSCLAFYANRVAANLFFSSEPHTDAMLQFCGSPASQRSASDAISCFYIYAPGDDDMLRVHRSGGKEAATTITVRCFPRIGMPLLPALIDYIYAYHPLLDCLLPVRRVVQPPQTAVSAKTRSVYPSRAAANYLNVGNNFKFVRVA
ncbi:hypothetical protein M8C21_022684, partial [Ambrosia artemisiifolia]